MTGIDWNLDGLMKSLYDMIKTEHEVYISDWEDLLANDVYKVIRKHFLYPKEAEQWWLEDVSTGMSG